MTGGTADGIDTRVERWTGRDWARSLALPAICIAVCGAMVWGSQLDPDSAYDRRFRDQSLLVLPLMLPFTLWVTYRLFWPFGSLIRLAPEGFTDRRVNRRCIPWDAISNVVRRGQFVSLTLTPSFLKSYRFPITQRAIKTVRRTARPSHLLVAEWCVARQEAPLEDLLVAYHRDHRRKGAGA